MNIQLALDRLTIDDAISMGNKVKDYVDWIEVGTSLIKEFGVESIERIKNAFPEKTILADIKTFDNARYEFNMCFEAGADVATVMGAAPKVSIGICMESAQKYNKQVMIDLLNTSKKQLGEINEFEDAIFCLHVSKDLQEAKGLKQKAGHIVLPEELSRIHNLKLALAGGINLEFIQKLDYNAYVGIVGSAITKADNPKFAAKTIHEEAEKFLLK